jgi:hypothetical protein
VTSEELFIAVVDALNELNVPFMISGSLASNFYGVPRATQDADLVVEFAQLPLNAFGACLGDRFAIDAQLSFEAVTGSRRAIVRSRSSPFEVELFGTTDDAHDRERFRRRRVVDVFGRPTPMPTAEDVVLNKLRWWKLAGRRKDFDDARNVAAVQREALDRDYMDRWARELDVTDALRDVESHG